MDFNILGIRIGTSTEKANPAQKIIKDEYGTDLATTAKYSYSLAFKKVESINRGVNMIVSACTSLDYDVKDTITESVAKGVRKAALNKLLNSRPNPYQSSAEFRDNIFTDYILEGNVFIYWDGAHMYHLPASKVQITPDPTTFISYYQYDGREKFLPDTIIHIKDVSSDSIYRGSSRLDAAERSVRLLYKMHEFQEGFFDNGAITGVIITTENTLSTQAKERTIDYWRRQYSSKNGARKPMILDSGMKPAPLSTVSFKEMDFDVSIKTHDVKILKALGVPPILLDGGNNANISPNLRLFYLETVLPIVNKFSSAIERFFGYDISPITSTVSALQPELKDVAAYYTTLVNGGVITPNEARVELRYNKDTDAASDKLRVPANIAGSAANPSVGGKPKEPAGNKGVVMTDKNKVLYFDTGFTVKKLPEGDESDGPIYIEGYASTNDPDRAGDVVPTSVWEKGMENYLKNPIVLAHHNHREPIGRVVEHKVDSKGLWIKARISSAAENVYKLIKDDILTAFSIGFRILDAEWNTAAEIFLVKELELMEISVVSVPCNQNTLFSLSKSFETEKDYQDYKSLFTKDDSAKGQEKPSGEPPDSIKEFNMDPKQIEAIVAKAAADAAEATEKRLADKAAAEKAAAEKAAAEKAAREAEVKAAAEQAASAAIQVGQSGAEKLIAEVTKRFEDDKKSLSEALEGLRGELASKSSEIEAIRKNRMTFVDKTVDGDGVAYADKEKAVLLSVIVGKSIDSTKYGKDLLEKALGAPAATGAHLPSQTWEHEVSMNMENEVRRRLVVAPLFRGIDMKTNVMTFPVNPEAGIATWITNAQFGTTASPGAAQTHQLKEVTLNAYKLSTMEYLTLEEEEDSLIAILPIVRDAMVRRLSRGVDRAFLLGAGAGADPVQGVARYDATSVVVPTSTGAASIANLRALRKDLGAWGLDPSELVYVVSTDIYYDLLDDTLFQTVDKVGDKATLLQGQIGTIGNTPVLVSDQFPTKAGGTNTAATNIGAICVAPANFLVGNQRGLRFDTDVEVGLQRRILVSSLRTGMTQITTNLGPAVSTLRWA